MSQGPSVYNTTHIIKSLQFNNYLEMTWPVHLQHACQSSPCDTERIEDIPFLNMLPAFWSCFFIHFLLTYAITGNKIGARILQHWARKCPASGLHSNQMSTEEGLGKTIKYSTFPPGQYWSKKKHIYMFHHSNANESINLIISYLSLSFRSSFWWHAVFLTVMFALFIRIF